MGRKRIKGIRLSEFVVLLGVTGILASIAIPTYVDLQRRSRIDHLLTSARSCREDLSHWLSNSVSKEPRESDTGGEGSGEARARALDPRGLLEDYARIHFDQFQRESTTGQDPLLVVEPTGTRPAFCRKDGRIHIIPFVDPAEESVGAKVVVTDENKISGPNYDGILAVYDVRPGRSETSSVDECSRGSTRHETR